jgi:hypothetical protein
VIVGHLRRQPDDDLLQRKRPDVAPEQPVQSPPPTTVEAPPPTSPTDPATGRARASNSGGPPVYAVAPADTSTAVSEMAGPRSSAERVAVNDATFRLANESIAELAESLDMDGRIPFLCECADRSCTDLLRLTLDEYESIRANPAYFAKVPGHEAAAHGWARVVEEHENFVVVEKVGEAAEIAEELDPRAMPESA